MLQRIYYLMALRFLSVEDLALELSFACSKGMRWAAERVRREIGRRGLVEVIA